MNAAIAASGLQRLPPFRRVGRRLLLDLVEFASKEEQKGTVEPKIQDFRTDPFLLVLEGELEVRRAPGPSRRVSAGHYYVVQPQDTDLRPAPGHAGRLRLRRFTSDWLKDALKASHTLARTIARDDLKAVMNVDAPASTNDHRIFLTCDEKLQAPLEALAELLAAGLADQFGERAGVVVLSRRGASARLRENGRFVAVKPWVDLAAEGPCHVIFVNPDDPGRLPEGENLSFHRIVYVTLDWHREDAAPSELLSLLLPDLWNRDTDEGPFFSSFIPTVCGLPARSFSLRNLVPPFCHGLATMDVMPIDDRADFTKRPDPVPPHWRAFRDLCRLHLDLGTLAQRWRANRSACTAEVLANPARHAAVARWARAVTNRQVGVAMSGGGAVNACLIPFLEYLADRGVPIDVVSGVSGGTLMGAYLCLDNSTGLRRYRREGLGFQLGLSAATVSSAFIEYVVDRLLGAVRVEDLETRLVAVTTELRDAEQPRPVAVVRGTVGEAVRASGGAPGLFGPAENKKGRYIDGATAAPVPARVLPDFGADVTFGLNAIGAVRERNLLRALLPGGMGTAVADVLYHAPLIGRLVDGMVAQFTILQQGSREAADDVDVYYEAPPEDLPIFRGFAWLFVGAIADAMQKRSDLWQPAADLCVERWKEFLGRR
jgi:predicted acylesterase/phospholipase RssA